MNIKKIWSFFSRKKEPKPERTIKYISGPFLPLEAFEVGDLVSTKPDVCPGGRRKVPVEEVGPMLLWGETQNAVRVKGLPYLPEELILVKKRDKINSPIIGLWE